MNATPQQLLTSLDSVGTSPALTLYGAPSGVSGTTSSLPRLDLSGKVLANHVAKASNYLVEELGVDPGTRVVIDLPTHWRLLTWGLGALHAGASVVVGQHRIHDGEPGTIIITDNPAIDGLEPDDTVIAVSLGALDMSWQGGSLSTGVVDGNAEVLGHADVALYPDAGADSNISWFLHDHVGDGTSQPESEGRPLLVDPSPMDALSVVLRLWSNGLAPVVTNALAEDDLARVSQVEGTSAPFLR